MAREGILSDSKFEKKTAKLTGAPAPGPQHFARILNRGLKGFSLEIERASFSKKLI